MTVALAYDPELSRVRVTSSGLPLAAVTATLERSDEIGTRWAVVRGGKDLACVDDGTGTATKIARPTDDYEFLPDELNRYRLTTYDAAGAQLGSEQATITPALGAFPWLKYASRPFLNRPVTVLESGPVARAPRGGVFAVVGAALPTAVSDVHASRQFVFQLVADTFTDAEELEVALSTGETVLMHAPAGAEIPRGYFHVGDVTVARFTQHSPRRLVTFAATEIAAPGPDVVGAPGTWETVLNTHSTWSDVLAAYASWNDVLELVGGTQDVITA